VPVGNARGDLVRSWLNPTSVTVGFIAVACAAYLAAVYLAADAVRLSSPQLVSAFRSRALITGVVAGAASIGGLFVLRADAPRIWHGLTHGSGLVALTVTAVAGVATLLLAARGAFGSARVTASLAVAAIVAGWGFAQRPLLLRTLTIDDAAAPHHTLVAILTTVAIGAALLAPSLALLFWLVLTGRFDPWTARPMRADEPLQARREYVVRETFGVLALTCFAVGTLLVNYPDRAWARIAGVAALCAFVVSGFLFVALPRDENVRCEP
jgi:cytochrome d ubiquinol oxidase subunit II